MSDAEPNMDRANIDRDDKAGLLRGAGERARTGLEQARQKAGDVIAATREKGAAVIEDTRDKSIRAADEANRLFQEHPIAAVAAAAAAGAVLGIFVPRLALGGKAGKIAGRAVKAAVASETAQKLWSNVREAGKSARQPASADDTASSENNAPQGDGEHGDEGHSDGGHGDAARLDG